MTTTPPSRSFKLLVTLALAASLAIVGCSGDDDDESPPADSEAPAEVDGDDGNGALDGDGDDGNGALDGSVPSSDG